MRRLLLTLLLLPAAVVATPARPLIRPRLVTPVISPLYRPMLKQPLFTLLPQIVCSDAVVSIGCATSGGAGGAAWGTITGTLSNQTDLQTALDAKLDGTMASTRVPYGVDANTLASEAALNYDAGTNTLTVGTVSITTGIGVPDGLATAPSVFFASAPTAGLYREPFGAGFATFKGEDKTGTDVAGGNTSIFGGKGTGNALGGTISFWVAPAGSASGSSQNALVQAGFISGNGGWSFGGLDVQSSPGDVAIDGADIAAGVTNGTGGITRIRAGIGTGTGPSGELRFLAAPPGGSGSAQNTAVVVSTINGTTGAFTVGGSEGGSNTLSLTTTGMIVSEGTTGDTSEFTTTFGEHSADATLTWVAAATKITATGTVPIQSNLIPSFEAVTVSKTPTAAESGECYNNTGDGDGSTVTLLNDPTQGVYYCFFATVAQDMVISPGSGETLLLGNSTCASITVGGAVTGIGDALTITAVTGGSGGVWMGSGSEGTPVCTP